MSKKVLIVDDELHIRMLYQEELESEGFAVATSDGNEDIVAVVKRENPDVIVLDIKLSGTRCGLDLLQELRSASLNLPVVLSTAYDTFQNDMKSIAAEAYVVKSVDLTDLKAQINRVLQ